MPRAAYLSNLAKAKSRCATTAGRKTRRNDEPR
jgi:hypothetical protein